MSTATDTYQLLRAFVDELARCGMQAACTSPGSRSAPLVLSLAREPRLRCYSHIDERCAGFFALGLAKATALPVALACTSGTAVAELLPAVIEAHEARVPLLVLSADRPPELRDSGAGQTIDQLKLFGNAAKWFFEVGTHEATDARLRWMRTLACRAYWTALHGRPGVVHLNFPLREPLVGDEELPAEKTGRPDGLPYVVRPSGAPSLTSTDEAALGELIAGARRGVLVAGRHERPTGLGAAAASFCAAARWPLLADPLSGARRGEAAVAHYDALLRDPQFAAGHTPDMVIRVGDLPTSKPLRSWLAGLRDVPQVSFDPEGAWQDPGATVSTSLPFEPAHALERLAADSEKLPPADPDWLKRWRRGDEHASSAILEVLSAEGLSEPMVAAELGVLLPASATLFVASSMPVRDVETFWPVRDDAPHVLCNRGANGIDGTVSSAFGAVAADEGPVVLLIGDVALAHDIGGLLATRRLGLMLTIVLLDNSGGGIFDFLPVSAAAMARTGRDEAPRHGDAERTTGERRAASGERVTARVDRADADDAAVDDTDAQDIYTRHIATPTGLDFAQAAALYGLAHERVADLPAFRAALERTLPAQSGAHVVEVCTERTANVELHRRVWDAVSAALSH